MDQVTYVEILGSHGDVTSRHAVPRLPITIGRAYDNDVVLDDPFAAPHHLVVEQSRAGELELADTGSRNGVFRVGAGQRLTRERVEPDARYRIGRTQLRIRPASHPVEAERVERRERHWSGPLAASVAVLGAGASVFLYFWSEVFEQTEPAKLLAPALVGVLLVLVWAGAWSLAGRLLVGERRLAAHLTGAALTLIGVLAVPALLSYPAFALSAGGLSQFYMPALGAVVAWGLWTHLCLVTRNRGRGVAIAATAVAMAIVAPLALYKRAEAADDLTRMPYLKAIKPAAVRIADGRAPADFFRDAEELKGELEPLKGRP
jgi:pSer/pThr/pTyr-binding forkhead associated (FHA) protein